MTVVVMLFCMLLFLCVDNVCVVLVSLLHLCCYFTCRLFLLFINV